MRDFTRLGLFLDMLHSDIYQEPLSEPHKTITTNIIESLLESGLLKKGMKLLDVGCGQGYSLSLFDKAGIQATGVTVGEDFKICLSKGFNVVNIDQNFMPFAAESFDFIWARHVLEHSPIPLFTIYEYRRLMKPTATLYAEVPAPDTFANHQNNINHYSVLTVSAWAANFARAGFNPIAPIHQLNIQLEGGTDLYYGFLLEKQALDS